MRTQQLFEAPFVSEVSTDSCSKYVSTQWNSRYHWKYCQNTPCVDANGRQSICIRPGAGKCICKRSQGEAPPPLNAKAHLKRNYEAQWLFETPYRNQEYDNSHSETDAMFGWAKQKWAQWRKGKTNPSLPPPSPSSSATPDVSTLVRQLDHDPNPNRLLTREERDALTQVVTSLISRSILKKKQEIQNPNASFDRKRDLRNNLTRLVNLGRFRFLKQFPQLRNSLIQALDGTDVTFPH